MGRFAARPSHFLRRRCPLPNLPSQRAYGRLKAQTGSENPLAPKQDLEPQSPADDVSGPRQQSERLRSQEDSATTIETSTLSEARKPTAAQNPPGQALGRKKGAEKPDNVRASVRFDWQAQIPKPLDDNTRPLEVNERRCLKWPAIDSAEAAMVEGSEERIQRNSSIVTRTQEEDEPTETQRTKLYLEPKLQSGRQKQSKGGQANVQRFPRAFADYGQMAKIHKSQVLNKRLPGQGNRVQRQGLPDTKEISDEGESKPLLEALVRKASVVIDGVSSSLKSSDFTRIFPPDLSHWAFQIIQITQLRHLHTLEPLNSYKLDFNSIAAATAYIEILTRLQSLGNPELDNTPEVLAPKHSEHSADADLKRELGQDPETDLQPNTIAPPSLRGCRVRLKAHHQTKWIQKLQARVHAKEHERPPLVLVDVDPPTGFNFDLLEVVRSHSKHSTDYRVKNAFSLHASLIREGASVPQRLVKQNRLVKGRHIVKFDSIDEARRFHRIWNNRVVSWDRRRFDGQRNQDHILHTSILEW